jgi:EpsI family protein
MPNNASVFRFLQSTPARIVTAALALQGLLLYGVSRPEIIPEAPPLSSFATRMGEWTLAQEGHIDDDTRSVLQADDLLSRTYSREGEAAPTNLFIAAFRSQRTGKAPHSPRNCLPGNGWMESSQGVVKVDIPGQAPIEVNRYIVSRGDQKSVVMYWYQSRDRSVASEYRAKVYVVVDSMRYNRTDTALVRVVTPFTGNDEERASRTATEFIQTAYPFVRAALPR